MRERLIELLKGFSYECRKPCGKPSLDSLTENIKDCNECKLGQLADYLLANGVIVPPCKVGDKTFLLLEKTGGDYNIVDSECVYVAENKYSKVYSMAFDCPAIGNTLEYHLDDFGRWVFLTKEEAEAALEGGAE